ncbi:MAG: hypothetical protein EOO92_26530 [Pedobacter sp.]|nr:MAG: hypothetical protein EOO92_26530 [Pedobacter sp.]
MGIFTDIHELIIDMVGNRDEVVFIKYCLNAKDLILGIRDKSKERIPGHFPSFHGSLQSGFFVTYFLDDLGQTMEDIIVTLSSRYQKRIDDKEYSLDTLKWDRDSEINYRAKLKGLNEDLKKAKSKPENLDDELKRGS